MKKRVVVTFVEAGQGHIVTAEAICESLEKNYPNIEVIRDWIFRADNDKTLVNHEKMLINQVKFSNKHKGHLDFQFALMKTFTEQGTLKFVYKNVFANVYKKCIKHLEALKPDIVISTHFEPAFFGIEACKNNKNHWLNIIYDPDHCVHGWWDRRCDILFTNNDLATKQAIEEKMFAESQVKQVNFLSRKQISEFNLTKQECRIKHNLPQNNFTVILADGAYASANLNSFTRELLKTKKNITIIPVCGRNEKLYQNYMSLKERLPKNITFLPLPFMKNIEEFYCASDLFITKAGPNAIVDSMFVHTPIMTNYYSGPIEKFTNKLFTKHYKTGLFVQDKKRARKLVEAYIDNSKLLEKYRENTYKFNKQVNGADEIAKTVAEALLEPEKFKFNRHDALLEKNKLKYKKEYEEKMTRLAEKIKKAKRAEREKTLLKIFKNKKKG